MLKSMIQNVRVGLRNDDSISKTQLRHAATRSEFYERGRECVKKSPPDFEGALEAYNRAIEIDTGTRKEHITIAALCTPGCTPQITNGP